ncbi:MAG: hypothetical protein SOZ52_03200, partial [Pyramidobacter sp.]|nr:hypothetical protein [Pyramidobacter sp.]
YRADTQQENFRIHAALRQRAAHLAKLSVIADVLVRTYVDEPNVHDFSFFHCFSVLSIFIQAYCHKKAEKELKLIPFRLCARIKTGFRAVWARGLCGRRRAD